MRSIVLSLAALVAVPATAQAPEAQMRYACQGTQLIVQIYAPQEGIYTMFFPSNVCGPSV